VGTPDTARPVGDQDQRIVAESNRDDVHLRAGHLSFNHLAVTDVHRDVFVAVVPVEEEVTGLDVDERYALGVLVLRPE